MVRVGKGTELSKGIQDVSNQLYTLAKLLVGHEMTLQVKDEAALFGLSSFLMNGAESLNALAGQAAALEHLFDIGMEKAANEIK